MKTVSYTLRPAKTDDLEAVLEQLEAAGLPTEGLGDAELFVLEDETGGLAGVAGLETHGSAGLLRSLAVAPEARGAGWGASLVNAVIARTKAKNLTTLSLLTTSAEGYFPRFGFRLCERSQLPAELEASAELRGACPASALAMRLELADTA